MNQAYVPTVFTSNGEGINNCFIPVFLGSVSFYEFYVFNRLDEFIFESSNQEAFWNRTFIGKPDKIGVYK